MTIDFLYPALILSAATIGAACLRSRFPPYELLRQRPSAFRLRVMQLQEAVAQLLGDTNYTSVSGRGSENWLKNILWSSLLCSSLSTYPILVSSL